MDINSTNDVIISFALAMAEEDQGSSIAADFVKLVSNDEHEFILKRSHALTSGTIKSMLSCPNSKNTEMHKVRNCLMIVISSTN